MDLDCMDCFDIKSQRKANTETEDSGTECKCQQKKIVLCRICFDTLHSTQTQVFDKLWACCLHLTACSPRKSSQSLPIMALKTFSSGPTGQLVSLRDLWLSLSAIAPETIKHGTKFQSTLSLFHFIISFGLLHKKLQRQLVVLLFGINGRCHFSEKGCLPLQPTSL